MNMKKTTFIIVTGLSGSGKSTALRTLEDAGFYAVDNLPVDLLHPFVRLMAGGHAEITRACLGMDIRDRESFQRLPEVVRSLRESGHGMEIIFLEASPDSLQKRFSETRRLHPLDPSLPLAEALSRERNLMKALRDRADLVVDTTDLGPHQLKRLLRERYGGEGAETPMLLTLLSFGYKFGLPKEADLVFDVRFLPNPYFVDDLREKDGRETEVQEYIRCDRRATGALEGLEAFLEGLLPLYLSEGRGYLTVAVGCTGGQHRSVAVVEDLARRFRSGRKVKVQVRHRELREE